MKTAVGQFIENFEDEYNVKITSYRVEDNVVKPGDNTLSGVSRMEFQYKSKIREEMISSGKVILKIPSLASYSYKELKHSNMYKREVLFYKTILPTLYQLGQCEPFAPKIYAVTRANALVLEDLTVEGFEPGKRIYPLNWDQCVLSLEVLAKYHALGYKYLRTLKKSDQSWQLIGPYRSKRKSNPKEDFERFRKIMQRNLDQSLYEKIRQLQDKILAKPPAKKSPSMTVLIHGDFRTNNILLKCTGPQQGDAKMIDFQKSREANPVLDLIHFFVTSVPIETVESHLDEMLNFYLQTLNDKLASLKTGRSYNQPELNEDITYYKYYYLRVICIEWLDVMYGGPPGEGAEEYISGAKKWFNYLAGFGII